MELASNYDWENTNGHFEHAFKENKDPSLLAFMAWSIQNRHNKVRFNEVVCPLQRIDQLSKERRAEFQNLHTVSPKQKHEMHTNWELLDLGVFKVNYDGAIFTGTGKAGLGVVIRNSEGAVMASLSQQIPHQLLWQRWKLLQQDEQQNLPQRLVLPQLFLKGTQT